VRCCRYGTAIAALALLFASCARELRVNVMEHPNREAIYLAYYRPWTKMLHKYGVGVDAVREEIKAANYESVDEIWDKAFEEAVVRYLEANHLIPKECKSGIMVVSSGQDEGGGGTTAFRCK
jgi:hypothetical protein